MRVLAVDAGNTAIKTAVFEGQEILTRSKAAQLSDADFAHIFSDTQIGACIWSSVRGDDFQIGEKLTQHVKSMRMTSVTPVPVNNRYATPQTLGVDRLAAVVGANNIMPDSDVLIISMGTTVTYDFISSGKEYSGGSISPGLNMRFAALNHYTAKLPKVETDVEFAANWGTDTKTSIISGVQNGLMHEINGFISQYKSLYTSIEIILTGGDAPFFASLLKKGIFAPLIRLEPDLVLIGLNTVYHYNDQHA